MPLSQKETHQTNPMAPWDALEAPLEPVEPRRPQTPRPPSTPKQSSQPHWTLEITRTALQIIRGPIK